MLYQSATQDCCVTNHAKFSDFQNQSFIFRCMHQLEKLCFSLQGCELGDSVLCVIGGGGQVKGTLVKGL